MCIQQAKRLVVFIPSPHEFIEYLPRGPVQGTEDINIKIQFLSSKLSGDMNRYGKCYGMG